MLYITPCHKNRKTRMVKVSYIAYRQSSQKIQMFYTYVKIVAGDSDLSLSVWLSVRPSVRHHTLLYTVCVTNCSHRCQWIFFKHCDHNGDVHVDFDGNEINFDRIMAF